MNQTHIDQMIARRVAKNGNPAEAAAMLDELLTAHSGDNLAFALHYNGFATAAKADKYAAAAGK